MAVSRIEHTTPYLVGKRWVHGPVVEGDDQFERAGHVTRLPIGFLEPMVSRVGRRLMDVLAARDLEFIDFDPRQGADFEDYNTWAGV